MLCVSQLIIIEAQKIYLFILALFVSTKFLVVHNCCVANANPWGKIHIQQIIPSNWLQSLHHPDASILQKSCCPNLSNSLPQDCCSRPTHPKFHLISQAFLCCFEWKPSSCLESQNERPPSVASPQPPGGSGLLQSVCTSVVLCSKMASARISRGTYAVSLGLVYFSTLVLDSDKLEHHDCMLSSRCCLSSTIHPNTSSRPQVGVYNKSFFSITIIFR